MDSQIIRQTQTYTWLQITTQQSQVRTGIHFKAHNTFLPMCSTHIPDNTLLKQNSGDLKWCFSLVLVSARLSESYTTIILYIYIVLHNLYGFVWLQGLSLPPPLLIPWSIAFKVTFTGVSLSPEIHQLKIFWVSFLWCPCLGDVLFCSSLQFPYHDLFLKRGPTDASERDPRWIVSGWWLSS